MRVREVIKRLEAAGFVQTRKNGSHKIFNHPNGLRYTLAWDEREMLGRPALRKIERDTKVSLTQ